MRILLSLFLPVNIQKEQENVESTIYSMDTRRDGEISLSDFIRGVRDVGSFKISRYMNGINAMRMTMIMLGKEPKIRMFKLCLF